MRKLKKFKKWRRAHEKNIFKALERENQERKLSLGLQNSPRASQPAT
jgi:hypothetical protein